MTRDLWRRAGIVAACLVPAVASALLAAFWQNTGRLGIGGDEPHYLIMAASLSRDRDLYLRNNYEEDARTGEIFGPIEPHVYRSRTGWRPYHTPGVSVLLTLPFERYGQRGARYALCLFLVVVPVVMFGRLRGSLTDSVALWVSLGVIVCLPALFGGPQIYPDLAAGLVIAALALWLWCGSDERRATSWLCFWAASGLVPWLHIKYAAPVAILALSALWTQFQRARAGGEAGWRPVALASPFFAGALSLAGFQLASVGSLLGSRSRELSTDFPRGLEFLLGLHFDQGQGMLFHHPALVGAGLLSLGVLLRTRHSVVWPWLVMYATLVIPNAMQVARYGGGGPAGRFGWSAIWLWAVPLAMVLTDRKARAARYIRPVVIASLVYQVALASRWVLDPGVLFPVLSETLDERNSVFPVSLRWAFPSFYFWDYPSYPYLTYLPNVVWLAAIVGWLGFGVRRAARSTQT